MRQEQSASGGDRVYNSSYSSIYHKKHLPACVNLILKPTLGYFPGGPVVKSLPFNTGGAGSIPGCRAKIPHASQPKN